MKKTNAGGKNIGKKLKPSVPAYSKGLTLGKPNKQMTTAKIVFGGLR